MSPGIQKQKDFCYIQFSEILITGIKNYKLQININTSYRNPEIYMTEIQKYKLQK